MPWITPTEDDLAARLSAPELAAFRSAALRPGQPDPVAPVLAAVTAEVRGYIAGHKPNTLGPDGTLPDTLLDAALALAVARLPARLPVKLTDERKDAKRDALHLLREVAAGRFFVPAPDAPAAEQPASQIELASGPGPYPQSASLNGMF